MGELRGFLKYNRQTETYDPVEDRLKNYQEFTQDLSLDVLKEQGARCMNCGIPFCHSGCPLGNLIPDFNDAVYNNRWEKALEILHSTNNFPEFTGRLCPAPCESACVLSIIEPAVAIETIEKYIVETGFKNDWIKPAQITERTGKKVAVIGSGPSGLAAAQQLNLAGHEVTVFERDDKIGGLLRYGIPDFKLEKSVIDRRLNQMKKEGITFKTSVHVGIDVKAEDFNEFDAILLSGGSTKRRSLSSPGNDAKGVVQAMDFLKHNNQVVDGLMDLQTDLSAKDKHVIVIGGGDTGSDCVGTSNRHGAKSVTNFEIMPMPSDQRTKEHPWPYWPFTLKITSSHEEGVERYWSISTKGFKTNNNNEITAIETVQVEWVNDESGRRQLKEVIGTEKEWPCDLALLALGFTGAENTLADTFGVELSNRHTIKSNTKYQTNVPHIFTSGDMRRGQSLIVWAISEGREAARNIDEYLMGYSYLPKKGQGDLPSA